MRNLLLLFIAFFMAATGLALAGNDTGNGTDHVPFYADSAWFLGGDKVIKVCHVESAHFGASAVQMEQTITVAFAIWDHYLDTKKFRMPYSPKDHLYLNTRISLMPTCDGSEDLKFYFGQEDSQVLSFKTKYVNPVAFNAKTNEDIKGGWSKGLIWVNSGKNFWPNGSDISWSDPRNLLGVLLHEIGHILGCSHSPDTIMDSNRLLQMLEMPATDPSKSGLKKIDGTLELYICESCSFQHTGRVGYHLNAAEKSEEQKEAAWLFELFAGRTARGPIRGELKAQDSSDINTLIFRDNDGIVNIPIQFPKINHFSNTPNHTVTFREGTLFKTVRVLDGCYGECSLAKNEASIRYGTARTFGNKVVTVVRERNVSQWFIKGPLMLKLIYQGKVYNLFASITED